MTRVEIMNDLMYKFEKFSHADAPLSQGGFSPKNLTISILKCFATPDPKNDRKFINDDFFYIVNVYEELIIYLKIACNVFKDEEDLSEDMREFHKIFVKQIDLIQWIKKEAIFNVTHNIPLHNVKYATMNRLEFYNSFLSYTRIYYAKHTHYHELSYLLKFLKSEYDYYKETDDGDDKFITMHEEYHIITENVPSFIEGPIRKFKTKRLLRYMNDIYKSVCKYNRVHRLEKPYDKE